MNPPKHEQTIFAEALRLPPEERAAFLSQATAGDAALRHEVESLLQSYGTGEFLEEAVVSELRPPLPAAPTTERPGDVIGPFDTLRASRYKLLQQIGEGGCGVVYMAQQTEPVRRRVALKIIKLGMDTKSVIARFEAERQALALMDHPNIAKVLDAGATETGRPYFVMELVRGTKITEFCDEKRLSTRQRLDLFMQVCQAIQHAHQKGIIHRDIKPSNILVSEDDGVLVPKVIDFGIAKATGGQVLTDKTVFTAFEQFIGTPAYMSPEQALMTNADIDTRSDIYALGVLLYELLTGKTPFDAQELLTIGLDEMRRTIRETEPLRPSTCLSTLPGKELNTTAQQRGLDAPKLISELRGDLDWIVMKALEKDRARRYETANGLAADVQRYLNCELVVARPPSRFYRLQKAVRRNQIAFTAATAVGVALMIGIVVSTWQAARAWHAEQAAEVQRDHAEAVLNFFREKILAAERPEGLGGGLGKDVSLRKAIDAAEPEIGVSFRNRPLVEAAVRHTLGESYSYLGEHLQAIQQQERAWALRRQHLGIEHPDTLECMNGLGSDYVKAGKIEDGLALLEKVLELRRRTLGPGHPSTLQTMSNLITAYRKVRQLGKAIRVGEEALRLSKSNLGLEHRTTEDLMCELSQAYMYFGKLDLAIALMETTVEVCQGRLGPEHTRTLLLMHDLARTYSEAGQWARSVSLYEKVLELKKHKLGLEHPLTLVTMDWLALGYRSIGKTDQALAILEPLLELSSKILGPHHQTTRSAASSLNSINRGVREPDELEKRYRAQLAQENDDVLSAGFGLGVLLLETAKGNSLLDDRAREGERLLRQSLAEARVRHTNEPLRLGWRLTEVAEAYFRHGHYKEAEPLYRELIQCWRTAWGTDNHYVRAARANQASLYADWAWAEHTQTVRTEVTRLTDASPPPARNSPPSPCERARQAEQILREVLTAWQRDGTNSWRIGDVKSRLGSALVSVVATDPAFSTEVRTAKLTEAESLLLEGYERLEKVCAQPICKRDAIERIVRLYNIAKKPDKRSKWQQRLEWFDKFQSEDSPNEATNLDSP